MPFKPGQSGNVRGRPKGSIGGRMVALGVLDRLLATTKNKRKIAEALQADIDANPIKFFKTVIMPLLPKEAKLAVQGDNVIEWRSLLDASIDANRKRQPESGETR